MERVLIKKNEILLLFVILAVALIFWLMLNQRSRGGEVVVEQDGEIICQLQLSTIEEPVHLELSGAAGHKVKVEIDSSGAAIVSSDCPDQICVGTGRITKAGEAAICLPERVSVTIVGGSADAMTY